MTSGPEAGTARLLTWHRSPIFESPMLGAEAAELSPDTQPEPQRAVAEIQPDRAHRVGSFLRSLAPEDNLK